jgi:hypothetical protein
MAIVMVNPLHLYDVLFWGKEQHFIEKCQILVKESVREKISRQIFLRNLCNRVNAQ